MMKFREDAKTIHVRSSLYDLFQRGKIKPDEMLYELEDINRVKEAIRTMLAFEEAMDTITEFLDEAEEKGIMQSV